MKHAANRSRAGFTLLEILVALVLIGLLAGAIVPAVLNQLDRGDVNRAVEDLTAIESAVKSFNVDVRRWPGDIEDLINRPELSGGSADATLTGTGAYTAGLVARWNGPYLERMTLTPDGDIVSPLGGVIEGPFVREDSHLVIEISGLGEDQISDLDLAIDGGSATDADRYTRGRIRRTVSGQTFKLRYMATVAN